MKVNDISPKFYGIYCVNYRHNENLYKKISLWKTQYTYRFMYVANGFFDVCINDSIQRVQCGDVLLLVPGSFYQMLPCGSDFSVYSISFDICNAENDKKVKSGCIFADEYTPELCSGIYEFEDAPFLNKSGVFTGEHCKRIIDNIICADNTERFYDFYVCSQIRSAFAEILTSPTIVDSVADKIVEYIRLNYDKDVSATSISKEFSYHPNYINKLVKRKTGKCMGDFIRHVKIECAIGLLYENDITLSKICSVLGYYDYSHFYKAFVAETGVTPSEYKKKISSKEVINY